MSKVLWIIGNGFDNNLGLETGYRSFLLKKYFASGTANKYRDELVKRLGGFDPNSQSDLWSDLESLLGEATKFYEDDVDLFHDTFEDIQRQLVEYVAQEEKRLPAEFSPAAIEEFRKSLCTFSRRLAPLDQAEAAPAVNPDENVWVSAITLNYTHSFDSLWTSTVKDGELLTISPGSLAPRHFYPDKIFHLHGTVNSVGAGDSVIFGVSDQSQFSSALLPKDPDFAESWVKSERNSGLLRNDKNRQMIDLVKSADSFCIYGCSLGLSDAYIWKEVGKKLVGSSARLYIFDYGLPDRTTGSPCLFQKRRRELIDSFLRVAAIEDSDREIAEKCITPVEASALFRFDSLVELEG